MSRLPALPLAVVCSLAALCAIAAPETAPVVPPGATLEKVSEGCKFTEGPAADAQGNVYFSDVFNNRIMVYTAKGETRVWKSGTRGANGMLFDRQGRLITCNSQLAADGRTVTRYERNGQVTLLADQYQGKKLNSPNDLAIDGKGRIYFTDPRYVTMDGLEQDKMAVYRIDRPGRIVRVIDDLQVPNGILITPDGRTLYVADNSPEPTGNHTLVAYDIRGDKVTRRGVIFDFARGRGIDGMKLDTQGNIYATAGEKEKSGVYVISPSGKQLGFIHTPEDASNCTFSGPDLRTLYITTATGSLYRIRTQNAGWLAYPSPSAAASHGGHSRSPVALGDSVPDPAAPQIIASGLAAGGYAAFPDVCRTSDGDLLCVFYSGYGHVSAPKPGTDWEWGGKIMATRSHDEGRTWSTPTTIANTPHDDRDPHIACLRDGTLILSWFVTWDKAHMPAGEKLPHAVFTSTSSSNGRLWSPPQRMALNSTRWWACSAPVRELKDHTLILGLYTQDEATGNAWGATVRSRDHGKSWGDLAPIGENAKLQLDAETDVVELKDGRLLAALRSSKTDMYFAWSENKGRTWGEPKDAGFRGHCPVFLRSHGTLLLGHRIPNTALHWSRDEGKTWTGPLEVDSVGGAYPGLVELHNGEVLCVYYEEGAASSIRARRLRITGHGVEIAKK